MEGDTTRPVLQSTAAASPMTLPSLPLVRYRKGKREKGKGKRDSVRVMPVCTKSDGGFDVTCSENGECA